MSTIRIVRLIRLVRSLSNIPLNGVLHHPAHADRQFVVSFPIPLRYWLHTNKRFATQVFGLVSRESPSTPQK